MPSVDLNCDMGESFGAYTIGDDRAMMELITSANVACGFHGGDPEVMHETFALAKALGVAAGAHPGFPDLWGFGRRRIPFTTAEIERLVAYQIGAAQAMARQAGHRITFVKAHGALGNISSEDETVADALARAVKAVDASLVFVAIAGTAQQRAGEKAGLTVASEIFADRAYEEDGNLMSRSKPGAVLHEPGMVADRVLRMVEEEAVFAPSGRKVPIRVDTICVHGDSPGAVAMARAVRTRLEAAGVTLAPFAA